MSRKFPKWEIENLINLLQNLAPDPVAANSRKQRKLKINPTQSTAQLLPREHMIFQKHWLQNNLLNMDYQYC
jgi:hypothetical protein